MPEWLETVLAFITAGAAGGLAKPLYDYLRRRREDEKELGAVEIRDLATFRQELWERLELVEDRERVTTAQLEGRIENLRGQVLEWTQKFFDVTTQNEILKRQNDELRDQNAKLKEMVAALKDENESLQKRLNEVDP